MSHINFGSEKGKMTKIPRPPVTVGVTYKIRPGSDGTPAVYMTVNDVEVCRACGKVGREGFCPRREKTSGDAGTVGGEGCQASFSSRPFEVFFSTRKPESFEWLQTLGTLMSAILRQPGEFPQYVIEELKSMASLNGGYFISAKNGITKRQYVNGVVHHIGLVLEKHCSDRGVLNGKGGKAQGSQAPG